MSTECITVDGGGGMATIAVLRDRLLDTLTPGGALRLDLSALPNPHLCIVQLVLAARRHAAAIGADFALAAPATSALVRTLERAGCAPRTPDDTAFWLHGEVSQ